MTFTNTSSLKKKTENEKTANTHVPKNFRVKFQYKEQQQQN